MAYQLSTMNETTMSSTSDNSSSRYDCFNLTMAGAVNLSVDCNVTNGTDLKFYSHTYRIIGTVFLLPILIVGVIGNVMVVTVVAKTRSMRSPTNCYLVSLALADVLVLVSSVPNEILALYLLGDHWVFGQVGCSVFIFLQYLGINASALSITAFTIERYIAICHPMKAHAICTISRAVKIICLVWTVGLIYCGPWLVMVTTKPLNYRAYPDLETCNFRFKRDIYIVIFFADLCLFYVIPLLLCVVLYSMIACMLIYSDVSVVFGKTASSKNGLTYSESKKCTTRANPKIQVRFTFHLSMNL